VGAAEEPDEQEHAETQRFGGWIVPVGSHVAVAGTSV